MSSHKSKSDLMALYSLEFYKKQKNWKLPGAARKEHQRKKSTRKLSLSNSKLNSTYNISFGDRVDEGNPDTLNVAFWESEADIKATKCSNTITSKLEQQWLEPVNIWPRNIQHEPTEISNNLNGPPQIQEPQTKKPESKWIQKRLEGLLKAAERGQDDRSDSIVQQMQIYKEIDVDFLLGDEKWRNYRVLHEDTQRTIRSEPCSYKNELRQHGYNIDEAWIDGLEIDTRLPYPEDTCSNLPFFSDSMEGDSSVDSFGEFIRGAHIAPHSSELNLALPSVLSPVEVTSEILFMLSNRQLNEVISRYCTLATRFLKEQDRRKNLRASLSLSGFTEICSCEEYPTRDVGLSVPITKDDLVAGSHRNMPRAIGKGRGRLPHNISGCSFQRRFV